MVSGGFFALLDDITSLLDDIAAMTKVAAGKTSAIVGDDLALNAKQLVTIEANRELAVVWAVAKGSLINKVILIPLALLISAFAPGLIVPLLMIGGAFLCFEGVEKILHGMLSSHTDQNTDEKEPRSDKVDKSEQEKIRGAVRTDFILSAEIIVIALGAASGSTLIVQAATLVTIGLGMTVVVYGLVAGIVKADDLGLYLIERPGTNGLDQGLRMAGRVIIQIMPFFIRALSVLGTMAMFTVGGGIIAHGIAPLHHGLEHAAEGLAKLTPFCSSVAAILWNAIGAGVFGVVVGLLVVGCLSIVRRVKPGRAPVP